MLCALSLCGGCAPSFKNKKEVDSFLGEQAKRTRPASISFDSSEYKGSALESLIFGGVGGLIINETASGSVGKDGKKRDACGLLEPYNSGNPWPSTQRFRVNPNSISAPKC